MFVAAAIATAARIEVILAAGLLMLDTFTLTALTG